MKDCTRKGAKKRTVQHYINTLKHYYDHLVEEGQIATNPAEEINIKGVKRKTLYHILEPHELHQLYNATKMKVQQERETRSCSACSFTKGLKTEELAKLETTDIKLREGKIEVPGGKKEQPQDNDLRKPPDHGSVRLHPTGKTRDPQRNRRRNSQTLYHYNRKGKYHQQPCEQLPKATKSQEQNPAQC